MKIPSRKILEQLSNYCHNELTRYRFNTNILEINPRYRQGRIDALEYLTDLTYYYLEREQNLQEAFKKSIHSQIAQHHYLSDTSYKQGLYDALRDLLERIEKEN